MSKNILHCTSSNPPLCSALPNGDNQWHFNDQDKVNCLNDYFASISTVNDEHTQLPPFTKLTDNSLSHKNCTEHEIKLLWKLSILTNQVVMMSHKMLKGVSKSVSKSLCIVIYRSFDEGIFPNIWKLANVVLILKMKD